MSQLMVQAYKDRIEEIERIVWDKCIANGKREQFAEIQALIHTILTKEHEKLLFEWEELANDYVCESTEIAYRTGLLDGLAMGCTK